MKDMMWQEITTYNSCSSYIDLTIKLSKIFNLELYTQGKLMEISNLFLNTYIERTMNKDLAVRLEIDIHGDCEYKT